MDNFGGEQNTRLERLESDIAETKDRLTSLEGEVFSLKQGHDAMQLQLSGQDDKLDQILVWVNGAKKVGGIAIKHWRTALKFGCGVVTAWGIQNPHVQHVVSYVVNSL